MYVQDAFAVSFPDVGLFSVDASQKNNVIMFTIDAYDGRLFQLDIKHDDSGVSVRQLGPAISRVFWAKFLSEDGDGDLLVVSPIANHSARQPALNLESVLQFQNCLDYSDSAECFFDAQLPCYDARGFKTGLNSRNQAPEASAPYDDLCLFVLEPLNLPQSNEIFRMNRYGTIKQRLTNNEFFDGEVAVSSDFRRVAFTSNRDGDYDLFLADLEDFEHPRRLTNTLGYEGGAQFAPDGRTLGFKAWRPRSATTQDFYRVLIADKATDLMRMDVYLLDLESGEERRITDFSTLSDLPELNNTWNSPHFAFSPNGDLYIRQDRQFYFVNVSSSSFELIKSTE
ncbi:hypothetical protein M3Y99_00293100 [Aphelenchoides fujianensis]|nr:hypothetical protein M3Y99_00293100 [Aphelenchoides fujianensis]